MTSAEIYRKIEDLKEELERARSEERKQAHSEATRRVYETIKHADYLCLFDKQGISAYKVRNVVVGDTVFEKNTCKVNILEEITIRWNWTKQFDKYNKESIVTVKEDNNELYGHDKRHYKVLTVAQYEAIRELREAHQQSIDNVKGFISLLKDSI
jgi:hypothetical protein